MAVNSERGMYVKVDCLCRGRNTRCPLCLGAGTRERRACARCGGMGKEAGTARCPDCRGDGWRDLDQPDAIVW